MVLTQSKILSSWHKRQKARMIDPIIDSPVAKLHDARVEMKFRKARLLLIAEKAKGLRKIKLEAELKKLENSLNEVERVYFELLELRDKKLI